VKYAIKLKCAQSDQTVYCVCLTMPLCSIVRLQVCMF